MPDHMSTRPSLSSLTLNNLRTPLLCASFDHEGPTEISSPPAATPDKFRPSCVSSENVTISRTESGPHVLRSCPPLDGNVEAAPCLTLPDRTLRRSRALYPCDRKKRPEITSNRGSSTPPPLTFSPRSPPKPHLPTRQPPASCASCWCSRILLSFTKHAPGTTPPHQHSCSPVPSFLTDSAL